MVAGGVLHNVVLTRRQACGLIRGCALDLGRFLSHRPEIWLELVDSMHMMNRWRRPERCVIWRPPGSKVCILNAAFSCSLAVFLLKLAVSRTRHDGQDNYYGLSHSVTCSCAIPRSGYPHRASQQPSYKHPSHRDICLVDWQPLSLPSSVFLVSLVALAQKTISQLCLVRRSSMEEVVEVVEADRLGLLPQVTALPRSLHLPLDASGASSTSS